MSSSLPKIWKKGFALRASSIGPLWRRPFSASSDALVEYKPGEIGIVSGIPQDHLRRRVVIYSPARTATQQGSGKLGRWKINFMSTLKWENPEEAAKAFAEHHGWEYVVKKHHTPLLKVKAYADNFKFKGHPKTDDK
ncbi:putative proteinDH-UBIQUINONE OXIDOREDUCTASE [Salix viminalis]|uniref:NADH dehydrogenase [ubiquinone] iron-sulfur protein 4, mitochondrial n=1 Tax=Salix viminalis TaxID=40686 RepID=A0A9Q0SJ20_SALVM|nr:putative proteinDH-UBIQUINONE OXIDOREDUCTASE [Salix viminalis]